MSKVLREPLLHFLLVGAGLFLVHGWIGGRSAGAGERIVITQGRVEQLATGYARMHQRAPDARELDALIDDAIREEIYYREAKALALDQDDTIIRRRLRQKLEFVSEDIAPVPEPSEGELRAYLERHRETFQRERRYSISHVYLNPDRQGAQVDATARRLLGQLQREGSRAETAGLGDAFLLGHRFDDIGADELARLFGADFETRLRDMPIGQWQGPVASGYGLHVALVRDRSDQSTQPLAAVRDAVRSDWLRAQRRQANERFYAELRKQYRVTVERPPPGGTSGLVAGLRQ